jgi:hypothetical protein
VVSLFQHQRNPNDLEVTMEVMSGGGDNTTKCN